MSKKNLKQFVGKIITIGRNFGPDYANDFLFPDGVRKEVAYVDNNGYLNYVSGLCEDNSPCYMCGICGMLERDIKNNHNISYIREANEEELKIYIKEVKSYFSAIMSEKSRPPVAKFPIPIIDKVEMSEYWKTELIREQCFV